MSIAHAINGTLVKLIKYSLLAGVIPEQLGAATIIPLYEKGSKEKLTNCRPISLLPTNGNIVES